MEPTYYDLHISLSYEPDRGFDPTVTLANDFVATINGYELFNARLPCAPSIGKADLDRVVTVGGGLHRIMVIERSTGNKVEINLEVRTETWITIYAWGKQNSSNHPRFSFYLDAKPPDFSVHAPPTT